MSDLSNSSAALAVRIGVAMNRLRSRLRLEQGAVTGALTMSQLSIIGRLNEIGPSTASTLAQVEHVRAQSVAETISALKRLDLVASEPDPSDGRKTIISLTPAGRQVIDSIVDLRGAWLAKVIELHVTPHERAVLKVAAEILTRVADHETEVDA